MNFKTHRRTIQTLEYIGHITRKIAKWAKFIDVQMKSAVFKPLDPIYVLLFLYISKNTFHGNKILKGAVMWLFSYSMKKTASNALLYRMSAIENNEPYKGGKLKTYYQVVNYFLETYATDDVITEPTHTSWFTSNLKNIRRLLFRNILGKGTKRRMSLR